MDVERRVVRKPLLGVGRDGAFVHVPPRALVRVLDAKDESFTEVEWDRCIVRVFTTDLNERTQVYHSARISGR